MDWTKLEEFPDEKSNTCIAKIMIFLLGRVENIVGKGENSHLIELKKNIYH